MQRPTWPLTLAQQRMLTLLGEFHQRTGNGVLLATPTLAANAAGLALPSPPAPEHVQALLAQLMRCAAISPQVTLHDRRPYDMANGVLDDSHVEFAGIYQDGTWAFDIHALADDDVAGQLAHEVGNAWAWTRGLAAGYRSPAARAPDEDYELRGSLAAFHLGLGVLAANAAHADRRYSELRGYTTTSVHRVAAYGGLSPVDCGLLLAIIKLAAPTPSLEQAYATLLPLQRELLTGWLTTLAPHQAEVLALLGPLQPRPRVESLDLSATTPQVQVALHHERPVSQTPVVRFTLDYRHLGTVLAATIATAAVYLLVIGQALPIIAVAALLGHLAGRQLRYYYCSNDGCGVRVRLDATHCPRCGGLIIGQARTRAERLELIEGYQLSLPANAPTPPLTGLAQRPQRRLAPPTTET